jgi:hypothetical protein
MAYNPSMAYAVSGNSASSSEYNKLVDNITDLNTRAVTAKATNDTQDTRLTALEGASAAVGAWTAVTAFNANWANRTGTFYALQVRITPGNVVEIIGDIVRGSGTNPPASDPIATVPSGFAPTKDTRFPVVSSSGVGGWLQINNAGLISIFGSNTMSLFLSINAMYPGPSAGV